MSKSTRRDKGGDNMKDIEKARENVKKVMGFYTEKIAKADDVSVEVEAGFAEEMNINTWEKEVAPNGEITLTLKMYTKANDGRKELAIRCGRII